MPRIRTLVCVAALFASMSGCLVEAPYFGPPTASSPPYETEFELTPERPVAIRGLRFVVDPNDQLDDANMSLFVHDQESASSLGGSSEPTWISIIDPESGRSAERDAGIGHASIDGWSHGLDCPATGCDRTWAVIVRWLEPKAGDTVKARLGASVHVRGASPGLRSESAPPAIIDALSVTDVPALAFDGMPAMTSVSDGGSFRSTPEWKGETHRWILHVPAALLAEPAHYPRLGRVLLEETVTDWTGAPAAFEARFEVGDDSTGSSGGPIALERDWLTGCRVGIDCEVPILVSFGWKPFDSRAFGPDAVMAADWTLLVMLEDSTPGTSIPPGLRLEKRSGS